jgi:UDP:flavonoid glycosyltransferase YjiC (YdhE family)
MRVLFTTLPLSGHFYPLIPIARALADADHEVGVASRPAFAAPVAHAGFRHFPVGSDRVDFFQRGAFADLWPRHALLDILALAATWSPDLIVRGALEYGGCLAAEALGLPHAAVGVNAGGDLFRRDQLAAPLGALRAAYGLPPDPGLAMLDRYLTLRPFPPSFQNPARPVAPTAHFVRPMLGDRAGEEGLPAWVATLPDRPVVYVGLGTVLNEPKIFRAFLAGLCDETLTLIVTVGRDQDPADYGPQPGNVHIERYVPLSLLLPHCDLVVTNGGSGTLTAALAHGLPLVVVPIGADQPENAARCAALGLGRVVPPADLTPETARQAVLAVLGDPACRAAAARLRDEIAALPGPEHAVTLLERLAAERQPIVAAG